MDAHMISEGWTKVVPNEGTKSEGMISEHTAPLIFEGSMKKFDDGSLRMEGIFQRANTRNQNGRIYPFNILERETKKLQDFIKENGGILGELDHPENVTVNMQKASHRIDQLAINSNGVVEGVQTLLPSLPMGQWAIGCIDALGGKGGVSSRGSGTLFKKGVDTMVGEDYNMRTYDIVHDPSTPGARPAAVAESVIREFIEWHNHRPSTKKMGGFSKLVDQYLGLS